MVETALGESGLEQVPVSAPMIQVPAVEPRREEPGPRPDRQARKLTSFARKRETESIASARGELFEVSEDDRPELNRKERKPADLKKSSFMDAKSMLIICLILIIVLMALFLFRDNRLSDVSDSKTGTNGKGNGVVTRSISELPPKKDVIVYRSVTQNYIEPDNHKSLAHPMIDFQN